MTSVFITSVDRNSTFLILKNVFDILKRVDYNEYQLTVPLFVVHSVVYPYFLELNILLLD